MKLIISIILFLPVFTLNSVRAQDISEKQQEHVHNFVTAVMNHDSKKVMKLLDKEYRLEQLKFLEGRKDQFMDELFGGMDILTEEYINTKFNDIVRVEVAEMVLLKDGTHKYTFRIKDQEHDILMSLFLIKKGKKFGFAGAMG